MKSKKVGLKDFDFIRCVGSGGFSKVLQYINHLLGLLGKREIYWYILCYEANWEIVYILVEQVMHSPKWTLYNGGDRSPIHS